MADTIGGNPGGVNGYQYDGLNRMTRVTQTGMNVSDKRVDFGYNVLGQFTTIDRFNDLAGTQVAAGSDYAYDSLNRLTNILHTFGVGNSVFFNYTYDSHDRITQIVDIDGATNYNYNQRDELTAADHTSGQNPDETYNYDANGNRINSSKHGSGYVTGPNNRLLSDGTYNYQYDAEGNMTRRTHIASGAYREFTWDYRNRLTAVVDKTAANVETQRVEFTYDAFNRRVTKSVDTTPLDAVDAAITSFVYDGQDVLLDFLDPDGTGVMPATLSQRYLHGPAVDQVLAQDNGAGAILWHLADHLGTVRDLADETGAQANHLQYDSYGNVVANTDPIETRYLYTGREFDSETNQHYYRARYYDANVGRFLNLDPIGFRGGQANLYAYVANQPISSRDPSGMGNPECDDLWWKQPPDQWPPDVRERWDQAHPGKVPGPGGVPMDPPPPEQPPETPVEPRKDVPPENPWDPGPEQPQPQPDPKPDPQPDPTPPSEGDGDLEMGWQDIPGAK